MYIAELKSKIPSSLKKSEDILTSNVFSFFKYAKRTVYLKHFLKLIGITVNDEDLEKAEFLFWPIYTDGTEPDLVIIAGNYYVLIEAKLGAGFGIEDANHKAQLEREYFNGSTAAASMGKKFWLVVVTADYTYPKCKLDMYHNITCLDNFKWINWQAIAKCLSELVKTETEQYLPNRDFVMDLLELLDQKKLRCFQSFSDLNHPWNTQSAIFFSAETAMYRGSFIGFLNALGQIKKVKPVGYMIFFNKQFFKKIKPFKAGSQSQYLFYQRRGL